MKQVKVDLNVINDIVLFTQAASNVNDKLILKSGKYVVDAKSIMGIYSLNLSEPVIVETEGNELPKYFLEKIAHMIV